MPRQFTYTVINIGLNLKTSPLGAQLLAGKKEMRATGQTAVF